MNTALVSGKMVDLSHLPRPSLRGFLEILLPAGDIREYSREYGHFEWNCFRKLICDGINICFLLNHQKIGFPAAGSLTFSRSEQSWGKSEDLRFELWFLNVKYLQLNDVKGVHPYAENPNGWKMLTVNWGVIVNDETTAPTGFDLRASGIASKSTLYCLNIVERAKTAFEKNKK